MDKTTIQSYNGFASEYAKRWGKQWRKTDRDFIEKFLKRVKPKGKILDAGCGTGDLLRELTKRGFDAYGIDASFGMLEEAKKHIDSNNLQIMDVFHLYFPDKTFDGVICLYVLQHVDELSKALFELKRVTKAGCSLYLAIHISENSSRNDWYSFPNNGGEIHMHYRSEEKVIASIKRVGLEILEQQVTVNAKGTRNIHLLLKNAIASLRKGALDQKRSLL